MDGPSLPADHNDCPTPWPITSRPLAAKFKPMPRSNPWMKSPTARVVLCDVTPRQLIRLAGERLPAKYRQRLERYRYGPGVFKMDFALSSPIPWKDPQCASAGTVHLGGTLPEIAAAEAAPWNAQHAKRPFVLLVQPTICDPTRAPAGKHTCLGVLSRSQWIDVRHVRAD